MIGRALGPYIVTGTLGQGGMGAVYRAQHPKLPIEVAIKVLKSDSVGDAAAHARFRAEVNAVAKVQHPNVIPVIDAGRAADGSPFYVMPLVAGRPLSDVIARDGPLEPAVAASHAIKVARGVHAVHTIAKALHRDLKPANVLIDAATGEPKLFDFGLARATSLATADKLTVTGSILGTPEYMAPEQAEGNREAIDVRTDVYGLGALLYALLTGQPPIPGEGRALVTVLSDVCTREPVAPDALRPGLPRDLSAIALQALAKIPDQRYPSALAFAEDLERFARGETVLARPPGAGARIGRTLRARAPWVATVAVLVVVFAAVVVWFVQRTRELELKAEDARKKNEQREKELAAALAAARHPSESPRVEATPTPRPAATRAPLSQKARALLESARNLDAQGPNYGAAAKAPRELAEQLLDVVDRGKDELLDEEAALEATRLLVRANLLQEAIDLVEAARKRSPSSYALIERAHFARLLQHAEKECTELHAATRALAGTQRNAYVIAVDADEALARGDGQRAYELLEEARTVDPTELASLHLLGARLFPAARLWSRGVASSNEALRLYPRAPELLKARGRSRLLLFEGERALEDLKAYLENDPDSYESILSAGLAAELAGSYDETLAFAARAERVQHDSLALYLRGAAFLGKGQPNEAQAAFAAAVDQDRYCARGQLGLCTLGIDRNDGAVVYQTWTFAKECFDHAPADNPENRYNQNVFNIEVYLRTLVHAGAVIAPDPAFLKRLREVAEATYPEGKLPKRLDDLFERLER